MSQAEPAIYPPINRLKPVAKDVWIVDGPIIHFGLPLLKMPFPTRMTVLRLSGRDLFIHSPTPLVPELKEAVTKLGRPRWIVGPNRIHYWWIPEWRSAFPDSEVYLAPKIRQQAKGRIDFPAQELSATTGYPWDEEIATLPVTGSFMTEVEFFHRSSRTLILTDLIENFEPEKVRGCLMRLLVRLGGVQAPHGSMPRDMRRTFARDLPALRDAVETMIAWNPERIILAHGRWFDADGARALRHAFKWLLESRP